MSSEGHTIEELEKEFREEEIFTTDAEKINFLTVDDEVNKTFFTGSDLDLLFGMMYVLKKHENGCLPLTLKISRESSLYLDLGLNWTCRNGERKLYMPKNLIKNFYKCKKRKEVNFIFMVLTLIHPKQCNKRSYGAHANVLIYDKTTNKIERFEPHGCSVELDVWFEAKEFDKQFEHIAKKYFDAGYVPPSICCPYIGPQTIQESERIMKVNDPGGFCAAWTLFVMDLRLRNPKKELKELQLLAVKKLYKSPKKLTNFIRNFAQYVVKKRMDVLNALPRRTINRIENNPDNIEFLSDDDLSKVNKIILKELRSLKQSIV